MTQLAGDTAGNALAASLTMPITQLYNFSVTTSPTRCSKERSARLLRFLKDQYLEVRDGRLRFSPRVSRDMTLYIVYCTSAMTLYSTIERAVISNWARFVS